VDAVQIANPKLTQPKLSCWVVTIAMSLAIKMTGKNKQFG